MIKNIIFDFGNVFISWNPRWIFEQIVPENEVDGFMQTVYRDEWNNNLDSGICFDENLQILSAKYPQHKKYIDYFHQHWNDSLTDENPESVALLAEVQKAGYATYGLSNWPEETFPPTMEAHPFFKTLTGIVLSGIEKVCKPDPRIYQILLERYELRPEECVFMDDRQENLDTAQELGIKTILFRTAKAAREELKQMGVRICTG